MLRALRDGVVPLGCHSTRHRVWCPTELEIKPLWVVLDGPKNVSQVVAMFTPQLCIDASGLGPFSLPECVKSCGAAGHSSGPPPATHAHHLNAWLTSQSCHASLPSFLTADLFRTPVD